MKPKFPRRTLRTLPLGGALAGLAMMLAFVGPFRATATETQFWQVGAFDEFLRGTLEGVSLTHDGTLQLAPQVESVFDPQEQLALSLAAGRDGQIYVGTGHHGKVFRVDSKGTGTLLFQAPESEILALAIGPDGDLYAASSPEGKVYRIDSNGKSTVFYDPKAKYIWSLAFDSEGRLYTGTGDGGLIYQVDRDGKGRVFFDSHQTHIISMVFDRDGSLVAGSDPDGLVFRVTPQGKGFVLYKADFPEIHSLAIDGDGHVYVAALGGSGPNPQAPLIAPATTVPTQAAPITVTVTAATGNVPDDASTPKNKAPSQEPSPAPVPPHSAPKVNTPSFNRAGGSPFSAMQAPSGRGALVRIGPGNAVETLWSSDKQSIFGLALSGSDVLFSTDGSGLIYRLNPSPDGERLTLVTETREALATRLLVRGNQTYVATSNIGKLFKVGAESDREGTFESPVKDSKFVSTWGRLSWRAQSPSNASLTFYTRSGNSDSPDPTWSDWAGPLTEPEGSHVASPPARYMQWKAVFKGNGSATPTLDDVTVAYLNQNLPPVIRSFDVSTAGTRTGFAGAGPQSGSSGLDSGGGFGNPGVGAPRKPPTVLSWQADDPNGDRLVYSVYLKATDERDWHLVKTRLHETSYTLDANGLADGEYLARVVASDEESNPPDQIRRAEMASVPFWVDNTPPRVEILDQKASGMAIDVHFRASSNLSPLRSAEATVDGGEWKPAAADDGMVDSRTESFRLAFSHLAAGEHEVLLRVLDTAGNVGVGRAVVRVDAGGSSE